jgi:hypothetical protein
MPNFAYQKTIALLFHAKETPASIRHYLITYYASIWREQGSRIIVLFGTEHYVAADLIVVHVDLSVVPEAYLDFASRYPIVLNGSIRDIRKAAISQNLLFKGSDYPKPVIVKSDCNYAGLPEKRFAPQVQNYAEQLFKSPLGYRIYPNFAAVPAVLIELPGIVVEKFLPEKIGDLYSVRFYNFLGTKGNCMRVTSKNPVVHICHAQTIEPIPFDPRLEELRRALKFDYGKFDYVEREGEIVLFDTNKTTGFVGGTDDLQWREARYFRAMGVYDYFSV